MTRSHEEANSKLLSIWDKFDLDKKNELLDLLDKEVGLDNDSWWSVLLFVILFAGTRNERIREENSKNLPNWANPNPIDIESYLSGFRAMGHQRELEKEKENESEESR